MGNGAATQWGIKIVNLVILICILGLLVTGATLVAQKMNDNTPLLCRGCNVILISLDTFGAKHASLYDPSLNTTPFLKELAAKGSYVFENAYVQAPWTLPSHTAMLTGEYPWDLEIWKQKNSLPQNVPTLAAQLKKRDFVTAAFSDGAFVRPAWGFDLGFDQFFGSTSVALWEDLPMLYNDADAWITESKNVTPKPFFAFIRPFELHDPFITPNLPTYTITDILTANFQPGGPTVAQAKIFEDAYRAEVRTGDDALKDFVASLESRGVLQNTVLIITSDHGEEFGEHGYVGHGHSLHRELLHVPLVMIVPGTTKEIRIPASVEVRSLPATIAHIVGANPYAFSATSLVPLMIEADNTDRLVASKTYMSVDRVRAILQGGQAPSLLYENLERGIQKDNLKYEESYQSSALQGAWHAIRNIDNTFEVYNMVEDPTEKNNLYFTVWTLPKGDQKIIQTLLGTVESK